MGLEEIDFEDFFENGGLALHVLGGNGTILYANTAELEYLGYEADEYINHPIAEFHVDQSVIEDILARLSRGEKISRYPARMRAKDGSIRHVEITSSGRFRDGKLTSTRCFTVDVSAAKIAEQRSAAAEHHWRSALDAVPAAIYTTDAEGRITYFNEAAVQLSGRRPELGTDEWCVTWRLFNVDGTPMRHDECPMAIALKENRAVRGAEAIAERPDGSRVLFQPFPTPLRDDSGKLIGAVNLLVDITEQRQAEADAGRLAAIVVSSNDAIISKSLDGVVTSWNEGARKIFGYEADEMIGQSIKRLIPPELLDEETQILSKLRRGESVEHYDTIRLSKDGRRIDISLSVSPVRDKSGKLIGASKVARDITQRRQAEETQKLLMGELNHRVKNTLATVRSIASQTLRSAKSPAEFAPSFLGRIQSLAHAHTLLTQSNWQGAELGDLILGQVLADTGEDNRITCSGPRIVLEPHLALHMALILHELGTNARKHGALLVPRGRVSITWSVSSTAAPVLDLQWRETDGPPIYVHSRQRQGFGTRLIEQSIRSVEGGKARMHLEAEGISWNISLPLPFGSREIIKQRSNLARPCSGQREARESTSPLRPRILVVEDEPLVAMDIAATLEEGGFEVLGPAAILDEALGFIAKDEFDAVLLDANLGGKPVDTLAAALTRRHIPFAFVTGYGRESLPAAFAAAPLLAKPFDAAALLNMARRITSPGEGTVAMRRDERA